MSTVILTFRVASLLAVAGMVLACNRHRSEAAKRSRHRAGSRAPLVANLGAFGVYLPALLGFAGSAAGSAALLLAPAGALLAVGGVGLVLRSRAELGAAWSLAPRAEQGTVLVTTGPYRLVRHPIYLGLSVLVTGQALAFASWPAFVVIVCGIVPSFAWRARAEEKLLERTFGDRHAAYCRQTPLVLPRLMQDPRTPVDGADSGRS